MEVFTIKSLCPSLEPPFIPSQEIENKKYLDFGRDYFGSNTGIATSLVC